MTTHLYTDDELDLLRTLHKEVVNPGARWSDKPAGTPVHRQRSFKVHGEGDSLFEIYQRQNIMDGADFSCGRCRGWRCAAPATGAPWRCAAAAETGPTWRGAAGAACARRKALVRVWRA